MSDDREREHCWNVAGDYLLRRWDCVIPEGWPNELADLIQRERAAAAAEAREQALHEAAREVCPLCYVGCEVAGPDEASIYWHTYRQRNEPDNDEECAASAIHPLRGGDR